MSANTIEPLLLTPAEAARLLGRSLRSFYRDISAGRVPRAVRLGASRRWRLSELRAWIEAGLPGRDTWERMQADAD